MEGSRTGGEFELGVGEEGEGSLSDTGGRYTIHTQGMDKIGMGNGSGQGGQVGQRYEGEQAARVVRQLEPFKFHLRSGPRTERGIDEGEGGGRKANGEGKKRRKKKEYDGRDREKKETAHTSFPASNPDSHHIVVNTFV